MAKKYKTTIEIDVRGRNVSPGEREDAWFSFMQYVNVGTTCTFYTQTGVVTFKPNDLHEEG